MSKTLIFTITTGRSGTAYLADFLAQNITGVRAYHERTAPETFGVDTPDASDLIHFNNFGVTKKVRAFWERKLQRVIAEPCSVYAETAHHLVKAGLIENLDLLPPNVSVKLIDLQRDIHNTAWSLFNRREFENFGWTWLWWLDPRWPNRIVPSKQLLSYGAAGCSLWYVLEIRARAAYYNQLVRGMPRCEIIQTSAKDLSDPVAAQKVLSSLLDTSVDRVNIPERKNATGKWRLSSKEKQGFAQFLPRVKADPAAMGEAFYAAGYRLGKGPGKSI